MSVTSESMWQRELEAVHEISQAFLTASRPIEVYRLALARVLPLVQASFASVFLRDPNDHELLRMICAHNWPQSSARYLGQLRIRIGRGPTGRAVSDARAIEVEDVFADPALREWWEPARELDFASLISLPLPIAGETAGALSFYFRTPHAFRDDERRLLDLIAQQLAATVERAQRVEELEQASARLAGEVESLNEKVQEADEARRLKDEFLANMSHELRTPLTAILGYAYLLRTGHAGELMEQQASAVAKIETAGNALEHLINDLLELSQLKLGRTAIRLEPAEAVELCRQAMEHAGEPPERLSIEVRAPDGPIPLSTDHEKVLKILGNLISNAFKFTSNGSVDITVRLHRGVVAGLILPDSNGAGRRHHSSVEWVVQDSGIGIRPDDLEAIFDEFRQVDGSSTRLYGGTGLGLALSLRLAQLLDGEILVESDPGRGSTFTLRLPVHPVEGPPGTRDAENAEATAGGDGAGEQGDDTAAGDTAGGDAAPND